MSLWTPDGERPVSKTPPQSPAPPPADDPAAAEGIDLESLTPEERAQAEQMIAPGVPPLRMCVAG